MRLPRVRLSVRRTMLAVAAFGLTLALTRRVFVEDWPDQLLFSTFFGDGTVYARGYDESKFRAIRPGMTAPQVERLAGAPLRRETPWWPGDDDMWMYTGFNQNQTSHRRRIVRFRDGKVFKVINEYYAD